VEIKKTNDGTTEIGRMRSVPQRILIVRLSAMGDVIHTMPAVHALRAAFPDAYIGWMIEERWAELLCAPGFSRRGARSEMRPLVDEIHAVNLKAWGKSVFSLSTLQQIATVWNDVREFRYDIAIDLQGAIRSAVLARCSGARAVYGTAQPREPQASLWYTRKVVPRGRHVVEQNASIAQAVIESGGSDEARGSWNCASILQYIPRDEKVEKRIEQRLNELGMREFAILAPGTGWGAKRWPAERYGEVARGLAAFGLRSILNAGPGEDELVREVERTSGDAAQAMKCTISELIALMRRVRLFVGADTGPLHLAAALQVPVVGIYGPTDPARNGPYGTRSAVLRSAESVTSHARRSAPEQGLLTIRSEQVIAAAEKLLAGGMQ
jgi:heptosyltransferase I